MSRSIMAGAACALWLAAGPAAADPFQTFFDICIGTNADREAAGARAKAAGWYRMPMEGMERGEEDFRDTVVYLSIDPAEAGDKGPPEDFEILITGWGTGEEVFDIAGVRVDACVVMSASDDLPGLRSRVADRLGFPIMVLGDEEGWVFSREGTGFRSEADLMLLDESELPRIARERKLYMLGAMLEDGMAALMLGAVRPGE
jgi:hypothetical protein